MLEEALTLLSEWAVGVHIEHEERMLGALEDPPDDDEAVARMNSQALDAMGLGI